jgi:hypothetical protein
MYSDYRLEASFGGFQLLISYVPTYPGLPSPSGSTARQPLSSGRPHVMGRLTGGLADDIREPDNSLTWPHRFVYSGFQGTY